MRKAEFYVPTEVAAEFAEEITNRDLDNSITGTSEDDELIIEVEFEKEDTHLVDELDAILERLIENMEEEEDDDEDDDDEDEEDEDEDDD